MLTQRQEARDRIVSNWTPQYEAARREHEELVERGNDTRALWVERREERITLIQRQGNAQLGDSMHRSLASAAGVRRGAKVGASAVENRGHERVHPVDKNQSEFEAITEYDDLGVPGRWDFF